MQSNPFDQYDGPATPRVIAPGNPYKVIKDKNEAVASGSAPGTAEAERRIKEIEAANAKALADAKVREAEANARVAEANANNPQTKMNAQVRQDAINGYWTAQDLRQRIDAMTAKYREGPGATSGLGGLRDYFPLTANQQFDTAANAARGTVGSAMGFTGGQLNTKSESEQNIGPYLPQSSDRDGVAKDKISYLTGLADTAEKKAISTLGGVPDQNGNIKPVTLNADNVADQTTFATNGTKSEVDPILKGIGAHVSHLLADPKASDAAILRYLRDNNVDPASTSIDQALKARREPAHQEWMRRNPGKGYPLGPNFYTKQVPLSPIQSMMNTAGQSTPGAFLGAAANAVSGNHLADINPQASVGLELLRQSHPAASFAGDAAGQALFQSALPMGRFGKFAELGKDAVYGAVTSDGSPESILENTALNAGGGILGRRAGDAIHMASAGIKATPSLSYLNDAKVPLTVGNIARGTNTGMGRAIAGLEDRAAGLPGYDAIINTARQRGMEGFDSAAFREAGGSGVTGSAGINELGDKVDSAYSFLDSTSLPLDAQYAGTNAGIRAELPNMTFGNNVGNTLNEIDRNSPGGALSGRNWQDSLRAAREDAASIKGQPFSRAATNTLGDVQDNLVGLASRQGPPNASAQLGEANTLYKNYRTLANGLDNGPAVARGEIMGPGRLDAAARATGRKFGSQAESVKGNRPFYSLSKAGMDVLPSQVPDSGTAGRALLMSALYGGGIGGLGAGIGAAGGSDRSDGAQLGGELGLGTALALLAPYSKTGQKGLQKLLLGQRPKAVRAAADYLTGPSTGALQSVAQGFTGKQMQSALGGATLRDIFSYSQLP